MNVNTGGGSPVVNPQLYQTTALSVISQAEQQDRYSKQSELNRLASYFDSGTKLLAIVDVLNQNADAIVAAGGDRIFYGGSCMDYLEKPQELVDMPGSVRPMTVSRAATAKANAVQNRNRDKTFTEVETFPKVKTFPEFPSVIKNRTFNFVELLMSTVYRLQATGKEPLPGGFKPINISRYGERRMKRSMRDLGWFLRYITYAIVADDPSILVVNSRGLRGVIPEDVTVATIVALKEMCWKALSYFADDQVAQDTIRYYFNILIQEYAVEKPANKLRSGISNDQQGLELPQSYSLAAESRPKFVLIDSGSGMRNVNNSFTKSHLKQNQSDSENRQRNINLSNHSPEVIIRGSYRQVLGGEPYSGQSLTVAETKLRNSEISVREFVRQLAKSSLFRNLYWDNLYITKAIESIHRRLLGRPTNGRAEMNCSVRSLL